MKNLKCCDIVMAPGECAVANDLAITPAQMENMTMQGKAIAAGSLELYATFPRLPLEDGLPLEYRRGVDINTAWEAEQVAKAKVSSVGAQLSAAKM